MHTRARTQAHIHTYKHTHRPINAHAHCDINARRSYTLTFRFSSLLIEFIKSNRILFALKYSRGANKQQNANKKFALNKTCQITFMFSLYGQPNCCNVLQHTVSLLEKLHLLKTLNEKFNFLLSYAHLPG